MFSKDWEYLFHGVGRIVIKFVLVTIGENSDSVNKVAERVLLRLRQKLAGVEDNVTLSISGQINHLIQEARDPKNLCRVFAGWQPYIWNSFHSLNRTNLILMNH